MLDSVIKVEEQAKALAKYNDNLQNLAKASNPMNAPGMIQDFLLMYDETSVILAEAIHLQSKLKSEVEMVESIAYLEKSKDYLATKQIKDTSEARKMYIPIDQEVIDISSLQSRVEALVTYLKNKTVVFKCAHDDAKKLAYGQENQ
jgi:hypothetical protein